MFATATIVPSGLNPIGPSSTPSLSGNGLTTPASALSPGAGPQTGPATRNAPPAGSGATIVDFPLVGSSTPMPAAAANAINPWLMPGADADGEPAGGAPARLLHAVSRSKARRSIGLR